MVKSIRKVGYRSRIETGQTCNQSICENIIAVIMTNNSQSTSQ